MGEPEGQLDDAPWYQGGLLHFLQANGRRGLLRAQKVYLAGAAKAAAKKMELKQERSTAAGIVKAAKRARSSSAPSIKRSLSRGAIAA